MKTELVAEAHSATALHTRKKEVYRMTTHTSACQTAIAEFDTAPKDSVQYRLARYIQDHDASAGLDLLLHVIVEDAPATPEVLAALRLLPSVIAEVQA